MQPAPVQQQVRLRGQDVAVAVHGSGPGPAVVLLPGGAVACANCFPDLVEALDGHPVVVHDRLGTGASPAGPDGVSMTSWAEDTVALLDQLGIDRAVFVGHSLGGALATQLLVDHPERVAGALLLDPTPLNDPQSCVFAKRMFRVIHGVSRVPLLGPGLKHLFVRASRPKNMPPSAQTAFDATFTGDWLGDTAQCVENLPAAAAEFSARDISPAAVPVVLVSADRKPKHRFRRAHEALARVLGASFEIWPDTGHSVHLQRPDLVIERTRELLASA